MHFCNIFGLSKLLTGRENGSQKRITRQEFGSQKGINIQESGSQISLPNKNLALKYQYWTRSGLSNIITGHDFVFAKLSSSSVQVQSNLN